MNEIRKDTGRKKGTRADRKRRIERNKKLKVKEKYTDRESEARERERGKEIKRVRKRGTTRT